MREALLAFIREALRDQGTVAGNPINLIPGGGNEILIRVAIGEHGPFEYYTIRVSKNI